MIECKVKINNYEYKVCIVRPDNDNLMFNDGKYHCGMTHFVPKEIYIANNLPADTMWNTLIHEVTHAYIDSYGLNQIKWDEEIVADFVGTYLINMGETLNRIATQLEKAKRRSDNAKRRTRKNRTRSEKNKI